ncbi:hypothetical protein ACN8ZM_27665 [Burkholderia aenigmatica]|uniref:hypothetical protein n=1 Tax=Burkholderia aenigmatica TaxID=2015348 RepID=UPI003B434657
MLVPVAGKGGRSLAGVGGRARPRWQFACATRRASRIFPRNNSILEALGSMKTVINFNYLSPLYTCLFTMTDDELDDFTINSDDGRAWLLQQMKTRFARYGAESRSRVVDALEYVLVSGSWLAHWRGIVPHAIPLDDVTDKENYVRDVFQVLAGRAPDPAFDVCEIEFDHTVGRDGIDIRK